MSHLLRGDTTAAWLAITQVLTSFQLPSFIEQSEAALFFVPDLNVAGAYLGWGFSCPERHPT